MSHKTNLNNVVTIGVCTQKDESSDIENAYLFGYLSALEDRLERLEFRTDKVERVSDFLDSDDDEDDDEDDEDEYDDEAFSNCACVCCERTW